MSNSINAVFPVSVNSIAIFSFICETTYIYEIDNEHD
jgi:hypothetical protein